MKEEMFNLLYRMNLHGRRDNFVEHLMIYCIEINSNLSKDKRARPTLRPLLCPGHSLKSICNSWWFTASKEIQFFLQKSLTLPTPLLYPVWPLLCPGHSLKILFLANCFRLGLNWLGGMKSTFRIIILDVEWRSLF